MATPTKTIRVEVPDEDAIKEQLSPRMTASEAFDYLGAEYDRAHGKYERNGGDRRSAARRDACGELAKIIKAGDKKATYTKEELAVTLGEIQDAVYADVPEGESAFAMMMAGDPPVSVDDDAKE